MHGQQNIKNYRRCPKVRLRLRLYRIVRVELDKNRSVSPLSCHECTDSSGVPRGEGGLGCSNPSEMPKFWQSCIWLQI